MPESIASPSLTLAGRLPATSLSLWSARRRLLLRLAGAVGLLVLLVGCVAGWRHLYPVQTEEGWDYSVHLDAVEKVSALARDGEGGLLLSQEFTSGRGRLLRQSADGELLTVQEGLSKPDGMVAFRGGVVFSQEQGDHPLLWRTAESTRELLGGRDIEGLASDGQYLFAIEDRHGDGRLLRYDPDSNSVSVLRSGLDEAEAVAVCPDGSLYYSEKQKGQVYRLADEGKDPVVLDGLNQPGFLLCSADGLWVTEDATHMANLVLLDPAGQRHTVLSHLRSAQTLLETTPGHYLLAEQGRNRVLKLQRTPSGN